MKSKTILLALILILMGVASDGQTTLIQMPRACFPDSLAAGKPLAGGKLFTYAAGTSTPQATYTDATGLVANTNPIILDAAGCASVWLTSGQAYRFVAQNFIGVQEWVTDQVSGLATVGSAFAQATTTVSFSATPTFTAMGQYQLFKMTLAGHVTSSTLSMSGVVTPAIVSFELTEDATGGRTFTWPLNVAGQITPINTAANRVTTESFFWDGTTLWALNTALGTGNNTFSGTNSFSGTTSVKNINQIVFADQFSGADCGAKINAALAAISGTQGTVRVNTNCGSTIATTVTPGFGQKLWFDCGAWTLTVSPAFTLTSGSHLEGCGMSVNAGSPVITGTIFTTNTASLNAVNFVTNANHVHISNIGFDGNSRTNVLGAALAFGSGNTANYVDNVAFDNWNGTVISLAGPESNDNHFTNIQSSTNGSNSPSNLPCIDIQGTSNANMFTNGQFDSCYYAGVRDNSGGGNSFTSFKVDTNTAPSGTIDVIFTGGGTTHGDKFANVNLRADANLVGNCIEIDNAITDTTFTNVTCNTFASPGASNIGFNVNSATAASIQVTNLYLNGFATGIKDISAAGSNAYVNIQYGTNTANTNFTNNQQALTYKGSTVFGPFVLVNALSSTTAQTTGNPVSLVGVTSQKAETGSADANVLTVTPPAAAGTYEVCVSISVASATSGVISWTLSWTDSSGNAQANVVQDLFADGTALPATSYTVSAAGNYHFCRPIEVNNAAANIVVKWVGGGTTAAKMSAFVERII